MVVVVVVVALIVVLLAVVLTVVVVAVVVAAEVTTQSCNPDKQDYRIGLHLDSILLESLPGDILWFL
jgi:hypothetical protein